MHTDLMLTRLSQDTKQHDRRRLTNVTDQILSEVKSDITQYNILSKQHDVKYGEEMDH